MEPRGVAWCALLAAVLAQTLLLTEYPELAEAQPLAMVRRDARGEAMIASPADQMPTPFAAAGDSTPRDDAGRAVDDAGAMRYVYFDLDRTLLGALVRDQSALFANGTAMDLLRGSAILLGERAPKVKTFTSGRTLAYTGYATEGDAPLLELSYAFAQLLRDPSADDTLDLGEILFRDHEAVTSRLLEAAIGAARTGDAHPEAQIRPDATLG